MRQVIRRETTDNTTDPLFGDALRVWTGLGRENAEPLRLAQVLADLCGDTINLYCTDLSYDSPLSFRQCILNSAFELACGFDIALGDYPDRAYVERVVLPHHVEVKEGRTPTLYHIRSRVLGYYGIYDRLMLPVASPNGQILSFSVSRLGAAIELPEDPVPELSLRERQCFNLLANGLTAKAIAAELDLAPKTVEKYIDSLKRKFGARNATQAVARGLLLLMDEPGD